MSLEYMSILERLFWRKLEELYIFLEVSLNYISMSAESEEVLACDNSSQWIGLEQRRCDNFRPESMLRPDANPVSGTYFCRIMQNFFSLQIWLL